MNEYIYTLLVYTFAFVLLLLFFAKNMMDLKKKEKLLQNDKN